MSTADSEEGQGKYKIVFIVTMLFSLLAGLTFG